MAISSTVQPTLHMSACRPCPVCLITSGAIQYGVPLMLRWPPSVVTISASLLLAPKSASLITPLLSTRIFAPLMSRCMIW